LHFLSSLQKKTGFAPALDRRIAQFFARMFGDSALNDFFSMNKTCEAVKTLPRRGGITIWERIVY
jgi:hypothetical protein